MTGFDQRLKQLLLKVRARAEKEGIEWRKADQGVFAFRAGPYVVTFARDRDPLIAIYDENGEEVEAIDAADLDGRSAPDGAALAEIKNRIWRLARRGAGVSATALDGVLDWLDERIAQTETQDEAGEAVEGDLSAAHGDIEEPEFSPQAPQAGVAAQAGLAPNAEDAEQAPAQEAAQDAPEPESEGESDDDTVEKPGSENGALHSLTGARPPWAR